MLCSCQYSLPTTRSHSLVSPHQPFARCFSDQKANKICRSTAQIRTPTRCTAATQSQAHHDTPQSLPSVDWTLYHLQILFVDRTDTVRARVATGLFERIAEWNGFGRALYPWACGVDAEQSKASDLSTTASLLSQAQFLGIRTSLFAAPAERLTLEDLDRHDVIVALDSNVRTDIIHMTQPEWHSYYAEKVCVLDQFSQYSGQDILKTGGTALLERELSAIVRPVMQKDVKIPDLLRPSLHKGQLATVNDAAAYVQSPASSVAKVASTLVLISPFFFWGTSMVAMKELAPHTSPIFVSAFRLLPAGVALVAWAAASGRKQPKGWQAWVACALFGLVDGTAFQGFLAEGLQRTTAGLGSVIIDSQPLSVALLAALLFGEELTAASYVGLVLGVLGLCLLELPVETLTSAPQTVLGALHLGQPDLTPLVEASGGPSSVKGSIWDSGEWWMLLAAQTMAVGTIMVRWVSKYVDPVMATGWHMLLGGLPLMALSIAKEGQDLGPRLQQLTGLDVALLLYISLLGSAASYGVFFYNASKGNLTKLSSLTFLTPMFAAGCGYLFLGEGLNPLQLGGATVTLGAVALLNTGQSDAPEES